MAYDIVYKVRVLVFLVIALTITCSCERHSHDKVWSLCAKAAYGDISSREIDELFIQANYMVNDATDIVEAYIRSNDPIEKADMISTMYEDMHLDEIKLAFDILRADDVQAKMTEDQLQKFENLKAKIEKLKTRIDLM